MQTPTPRPVLLTVVIGLAVIAGGCGDDGARHNPAMPHFDSPELQQGRATWMQVCRNCHLAGVAGAPRIDDAAAWQDRTARGLETLYASAINGIAEPAGGWRMPPRGGSDRLSDAAVRNAVDYMLATARDTGARP